MTTVVINPRGGSMLAGPSGGIVTAKRARKMEKRARQAKRNTLADIEAEKASLLASGLITTDQAAEIDMKDADEEA
jgi:hypothetical protein